MRYNVIKKTSIDNLELIISTNKLTDNDWKLISRCQCLTEEFMDKYSDKIEWTRISIYQTLSESFIDKYSEMVVWDNIIIFQELTYEFLEKYLYNFNLCINHIGNYRNENNISKLQEKYTYKFYIDKLSHKLSHEI